MYVTIFVPQAYQRSKDRLAKDGSSLLSALEISTDNMRYGVNFLQSVQLLCNVGVLVIQNGQSLSQVAKFRLCYAICCLIWDKLGTPIMVNANL